MKVPNDWAELIDVYVSLSRLQNEGSQPASNANTAARKSIKATE